MNSRLVTQNQELMEEKGVNFDFRKKDEILCDVHVESEKVDNGIELMNKVH